MLLQLVTDVNRKVLEFAVKAGSMSGVAVFSGQGCRVTVQEQQLSVSRMTAVDGNLCRKERVACYASCAPQSSALHISL